jgi:predicted acyl esterase
VPTEIEVELWSTALVFNAGHRIRIAIAGTNWDRFEVNPNDGGDLNNPNPILANPEILFGPQYPSAIFLPVYYLFDDGFETGDTSRWTSTVP